MSALAEFDGTSLPRPLEFDRPASTIRCGGILDEQGTTSGLVWTIFVGVDDHVVVLSPRGCRATPAVERPNVAAEALTELRTRTGFTWEQVARVLAVTPRTPFLWLEGKAISKSNEERLQRLLGVIRRVERASPDATRAALLGVRADGLVPFDLLAQGEFDRVEALLGGRLPAGPVAREALEARLPFSPIDRLTLSDEKLHEDSPRGRVVRAKRVKRGD